MSGTIARSLELAVRREFWHNVLWLRSVQQYEVSIERGRSKAAKIKGPERPRSSSGHSTLSSTPFIFLSPLPQSLSFSQCVSPFLLCLLWLFLTHQDKLQFFSLTKMLTLLLLSLLTNYRNMVKFFINDGFHYHTLITVFLHQRFTISVLPSASCPQRFTTRFSLQAGILCQPRQLYSYTFLGRSRYRYCTTQRVQVQSYILLFLVYLLYYY